MRLRILYIVSDLQPSGTTAQLKLLAAGLPRSKFEIHIAALNAGGPAAADLERSGAKVTVIGRRWKIDPFAFRRLRTHIKHLQPTVVHTWQFEANTYGRTAALAAGMRRLVTSERTIESWSIDYKWAIDRCLAHRTERMITNSVAVRNYYVAHGLPPEKFTVIPGAAAAPPPDMVSRSDLLTEFRLPEDAKLIAYVGHLTKQKRLKELIWAIDQLKAVGVPAHFLVIGQGPRRDHLERYSWLNRIEDRVHFLGVRNDVLQFMPHFDVLWHAGDHEGQSAAVLEAMAAGVPVVAADAAGNRELVKPNETGYLVPLDERAGFARATLPLLEDSALARRLGCAAKQCVEQCHRIDQLLAAYTKLYENSHS
ncbi:MAG TPA: glycosyltransferase [Pirellulales bacterium]|jgi:glycosyltransferase involved in cell wall biosynthesis|nr:glycosyltransferase [Pirellulales bacterium]